MLKFYETKEKMQTLSAYLTWSHYCELLSIEALEEISTKMNDIRSRIEECGGNFAAEGSPAYTELMEELELNYQQ